MVGVILALAFQRLQLYEAAYGFTRLRISTQGFLVWLALLPALIVLLEILRRERAFALAALLAAAGFAASLMLMTVVAVIVHQNFTFSIWGADLDMT
jgi:glucan phosphoethanolaminetransferase (alkaline phosphatase superfamily)